MDRKQIEEMTLAQEALHCKINKLAKTIRDPNEVGPIRDGVFDIEAYLKSPLKLMWILKEPYDDFNEKGQAINGDYTLLEDINRNSKLPKMPSTVQRVIYATYGIFTDYEYDDMEKYDEPEMFKYLFQIAYINLSKMPAYTTSGDMTSKYYTWREIVLKQIDLFQPNVLIFGGTFQYIKEDLEIYDTNRIHNEEEWKLKIYKQNGKLYIDTYHPGVRRSPRTYVNLLVNNICKYREQINIEKIS